MRTRQGSLASFLASGALGAALLGLFGGCSAETVDDHDLGSQQSPILGGVATAVGDWPTTVAIYNGGLCTGTLVAPDLVITAAHCLDPKVLGMANQDAVTKATRVIFDNVDILKNMGGGTIIAAAATIPNPNFDLNNLGQFDIGVVRLKTKVTDRAPTLVNRKHDNLPLGTQLTQVGFGISDATQLNNPNTTALGKEFLLENVPTVTCTGFDPSLKNDKLLCFSQTNGKGKCEGDSGGPSFANIGGKQWLVGVTSFGDNMCGQFGADTRVDAELFFLDDVAPELKCQADGECAPECGAGTLPADPDCSACTDDSQCPDGRACVDGRCAAKPFTPGGLGSDCTDNNDCESGLCGSVGDEKLCTEMCSPSASSCPADFDCRSAGASGACWPGDSGGCGCSVGARHTPATGLLGALGLLGLVALGFRRRRR